MPPPSPGMRVSILSSHVPVTDGRINREVSGYTRHRGGSHGKTYPGLRSLMTFMIFTESHCIHNSPVEIWRFLVEA